MTFGERLLKLRKEKGLSQEELAARITVSRQAVSRWEMGASMPDAENLIELCRLFEVSADYLLLDERESSAKASCKENDPTEKKRIWRPLLIVAIAINFLVCALIYATTDSAGVRRLAVILAGAFLVGLVAGYLFKRRLAGAKGALCPVCGHPLIRKDGRALCAFCGFSRGA